MSFVQRELDRIQSALINEKDETVKLELHAAQQALAWSQEPTGFKSPYAMIKGTQADSADCSAHSHPLSF